MGDHLGSQESLSQYLENGLLGFEANVVHALWMVKAQPGALSTSEDNDSNLTLSDDIVTHSLLRLGDVFGIDHEVLLDSFEIGLGIRFCSCPLNHKVIIQLVGCRWINACELVQQRLPLLVVQGIPVLKYVVLSGSCKSSFLFLKLLFHNYA